MSTDKTGFLEELKRRHVWRVAVAYAVVAWLLVQVATQVFPFFNIPNWAVRLVVVVLAIGFPIAVVCAWIYELTPKGIRRTVPADAEDVRSAQTQRQIGRKLNVVIVAVLVLAVALLGWRLLVVRRASAPAVTKAMVTTPKSVVSPSARTTASSTPASATPLPAATAVIPEKSVAVLPFANDSGHKDQQFFSDGLTEDLINTLSQYQGLKVISRNSAFQFRNSTDSSAKIGQLLGVAHLLEGSVQRAGDEVRITATLVNASNGSVVWSQRYDQPYKDLFKLQDAITDAVADALRTKLVTAPGAVLQSDRPPSGSLAAYTAYQRGIAAPSTEAGSNQAIAACSEAIRLDPNYAAAYAQLSMAWDQLVAGFLSDPAQVAQGWTNARKAAATALKLDPDLALAHEAHGNLLLNAAFDWTGAKTEYRRALQLAPNDALAQFDVGFMQAVLGQVRPAATLTRKVLAADPRNSQMYEYLSKYLAALGQEDAAQQAIDTAIALQPGAASYHNQRAVIEILRGDAKAALAAAKQEPPGPWHAIAMALALQIGSDRAAADAALKALIAHQATASAYQIAEVYALRRNPDAMFQWLDRAWTNRDPGIAFLLNDPLILRYKNDPRFAAFCKKVGLPTTTDAVAMKP